MKRNNILGMILCAVTFVSCNDFLIEEEAHLISEDEAYTSESTTLPAVLGLYEGLVGANMPSGANYYIVLTTDLTHHFDESFRTFFYNSTDIYLSDIYADRYEIIGRANEIIDAMLGNPFANSEQYAAEAKFVRAYLYFDLARLFGGVPLIVTKPDDYFDEAFLNVARSTEEEVYIQVIRDLNGAIEGLPATATSGRPSADAARGLLARVQLYRASVQQRDGLGTGSDFYEDVVELCNTIIESGRYELAEFYHAIFHPRFEVFSNDEVLFKINQDFGDDLSDDSYNPISPATAGLFGGGNGGTFRITYKAFTNYSKGDSVRRMKNMLRAEYEGNYSWLLGGGGDFRSNEYLKYLPDIDDYKTEGSIDMEKATESQTEGRGPFAMVRRITPNKFSNYPLSDPFVENTGTAVDVPIIRMGEIYLMMAEALNEVNGSPSIAGPSGLNAYDYVNAVRRRANVAFDDGGDYVALNGDTWSEVPDAVSDWGPGYYGEDWFGNPFYTSRVKSALEDNSLTFWNYGGDYEAFRQEIIWERARELFMEQGTRFHDLVRRGNEAVDEVFMVDNLPGMYVNSGGVSQRYTVDAWQGEVGIERFASTNNFKLPIPLEQLNNNSALTQNDGY